MTAIVIGAILYAIGITWLVFELLTSPWGEETAEGYGPINIQTRVASERDGSCPSVANPGGGDLPTAAPTPLKTPDHSGEVHHA